MARVYLIIIFIAAVFLLILSLTKINLRIKCQSGGKDFKFSLRFSVWRGLFSYKLEIPSVEIKGKNMRAKESDGARFRPFFWPILRPAFKIRTEVEGREGRPIAEEKITVRSPGFLEAINKLLKNVVLFQHYKPAVVYLLSRIKLQRLRWQTEIGVEDPSQTGFLIGAAWGVKGSILTFLYTLISTGRYRPVVTITPNFEKACFNTMLDFSIDIRAGHIFFTGVKALLLKLR